MDPIAVNSSNTMVDGGKVAGDDIPKDGTGEKPQSSHSWTHQSLTRDTGVLKLDPWLSPFQDSLKRRYAKAQEWIKRINETEGGLDKFSKVHTSAHPRLSFGV
jgi:1,4-alpha-glucan branching enzyme